MRWVLPLAIAVPLMGAAAGTALATRPRLQRPLGFGGTGAVLALSVVMAVHTSGGRVAAVQVGGWPAGIAIPLAVDLFAALMLAVSALLIVVCLAFAVARGEDRGRFFHPLVLILTGGIAAAFLTADLFNLFVAFEVMLIASYILLTLGGPPERVRAGAVYVTTNLLGSTLLVAGVALLYGAAGTVNLAALAGLSATTPEIGVAAALILVAFAVKSALVPVHGWLPRSYPAATPAVAALFSGILTKVGVYALFRVYSLLFGAAAGSRVLVLVIAAVTMVVGVAGALGRDTMREILSFHIVSQIGYMIMGLGLFGVAGLAGGIFYILHHMVVKTSLFLSAGAVETLDGSGDPGRLGGVARRRPVLAAAFVVAALSLAGLPPLSGFFAKLALVQAAFSTGDHLVAAISLAVSLFTLLSMLKIWNGVFWGRAPGPVSRPAQADPIPVAGGSDVERRAGPLVAPAAVLAALTVAVGLGAGWLAALSARAAGGLVDPAPYIRAVLGS